MLHGADFTGRAGAAQIFFRKIHDFFQQILKILEKRVQNHLTVILAQGNELYRRHNPGRNLAVEKGGKTFVLADSLHCALCAVENRKMPDFCP